MGGEEESAKHQLHVSVPENTEITETGSMLPPECPDFIEPETQQTTDKSRTSFRRTQKYNKKFKLIIILTISIMTLSVIFTVVVINKTRINSENEFFANRARKKSSTKQPHNFLVISPELYNSRHKPETPKDILDIYKFENNSFELQSSFKKPYRAIHPVMVFNEKESKLELIGDYFHFLNKHGQQLYDDNHGLIDLETGEYVSIPESNFDSRAYFSAVHHEKIGTIVIGGFKHKNGVSKMVESALNTALVISPGKKIPLPELNLHRAKAVSTWNGDIILVTGGFTRNYSSKYIDYTDFSTTVEMLDLTEILRLHANSEPEENRANLLNSEWKILKPLKHGVTNHLLHVNAEQLFTVGGSCRSVINSTHDLIDEPNQWHSVEKYDLNTEESVLLPNHELSVNKWLSLAGIYTEIGYVMIAKNGSTSLTTDFLNFDSATVGNVRNFKKYFRLSYTSFWLE